jgi:hypothetical protein
MYGNTISKLQKKRRNALEKTESRYRQYRSGQNKEPPNLAGKFKIQRTTTRKKLAHANHVTLITSIQ